MSATTSKQEVPVTITYHQPGTQPPVFLAGNFSQWTPQEMSYTTTDAGEHFFTETIKVPEGTEIQYKFRLGPGDWWALDETAEKGQAPSPRLPLGSMFAFLLFRSLGT